MLSNWTNLQFCLFVKNSSLFPTSESKSISCLHTISILAGQKFLNTTFLLQEIVSYLKSGGHTILAPSLLHYLTIPYHKNLYWSKLKTLTDNSINLT